MSNRIMQVFYGNDYLPYKDKDLTIHYPIVGNEFVGSNNVTEIRFYCDNLNANATYVANIKLPNGRLTSRLLVSGADNDGNYKSLALDYKITELKGNVYISLNGYSGLVDITDENEDGIFEINGTPDILVTGVINIAMNYAPIVVPYDNLEFTEYQQLLALIGNKANKELTIAVISSLSSQYSEYANGQIIYVKSERKLYSKHDSQLTEITLKDIETVNSTLTSVLSRLSNVEANKADRSSSIELVVLTGSETLEELYEEYKSSSISNKAKPFVAYYNDVFYYCAIKKTGTTPYEVYFFEFENAFDNSTYIGEYVFGNVIVSNIIKTDSAYKQKYATSNELNNYATKQELQTKADLVNGKVPSSQLPSYVDDIKVFEKAYPFNKTFNLELEDMGLFVNTFANNDRAVISRLSSILDLDGASHQTLTSFGYFLVDITTTFSIMGSEANQTACYVYHFVEVSGGVQFKQLTNEELQDVIATNILLCHQTNKSYRVINREIPFGQNILGTTESRIALTNTTYFAEIVSTLALGETSSTAFAGNRGKALETRMTSVESSVANIPNEIEEQFNDRIGSTKIVNLTQSEYEALETKDPNTMYFVVED